MKVDDIVIIKECHSLPILVDRKAKVARVDTNPDVRYPILVVLVEPITAEIPIGMAQIYGPFSFREDELELAPTTEIPDSFLKALDN